MKTKGLFTRTCPMCCENFICMMPEKWAYRRNARGRVYTMCSWHCLLAFDAKVNSEKEHKKNGKRRNKK